MATIDINIDGGGGADCQFMNTLWADNADHEPVTLFTMEADSVYEWNVDAGGHPLHAHVNHLQLMDTTDEWNVAGDWMDVYEDEGLTRLKTDRFLGWVIMHCTHIE